MSLNVTQKLIQSHLMHGQMKPGEEIGIRIDQTLTQDATGTLVMLELEAMELDQVKTEISVQYVDHNIVQADYKNADDHLFLRSACQRFGLWYSAAGNGVSHPCHQENFGKPGKTLLGSDSHTPAGGALGMLAIGAGGLEVALAMAGEPFFTTMPQIWGVKLVGQLPDWVSAKDVILEMLRRHGVEGGIGRIIEYYGPGLDTLSAMDRHVIANMGAELGATTTVFPSDNEVRRFLRAWKREDDWAELVADSGAGYDLRDEIDLSSLEPLIAMPSSPGQREARSRSCGRADLPGLHWVVRQSRLPRFRNFGRHRARPAGEQPRFARCQSDVSRAARDVGARWPYREPNPRRRAAASGRLQRLHRHGPGAGYARALFAHGSPQLSWTIGYA